MIFIKRLGYYLGGFAIGLIFLAFFLSGKRTSCDYGPNARTVKNISIKKKKYSSSALLVMKNHSLDSTIVNDLIRFGNVNFSESDTKSKPCKSYLIENTYKERDVSLQVKNCDSLVTISTITFQ